MIDRLASPLERVRASCEEVAARATRVHIDEGRIAPYAAWLSGRRLTPPQLDPAHHYAERGEGTLAYLVTLDAINFGSGYFPHLQKLPGLSGYFTVATRLKERFEAQGPMSALELQRLTAADCAAIFRQEPDDGARSELMALFARALKDLGTMLLERFGGEFSRLVRAAGESAARLVDVLSEMPFFRDVQPYLDRQVHFYKRAQLTAADLSIAFRGESWGRFTDLDRLTIFADNLVPHVLRVDGLLAYDETLAARIEAGEIVPAGSPEEVEIRASAVHVVELLAAETRRTGSPMRPLEIDYILWNRGQEPQYKAQPRHRTRTVFY